MPALYTVRVYYNTGFDAANIPSAPSVLALIPQASGQQPGDAYYRDYDSVWEWQHKYIAKLRVKAAWEEIQDADYLRLTSTATTGATTSYWVINGITMLSAVTAELSVTLDPINTAGGVDAINGVYPIQIISGWATRAHTDDDTMFANTLPEPWVPSQRLEIRGKTRVNDTTVTRKIVGATCDLREGANLHAAVAELGGSTSLGATDQVVYPELPRVVNNTNNQDGTELHVTGDTGILASYAKYTLPGIWLYNLSESNIQLGINAMRSLGLEGAITCMYVVPVHYWLDGQGVQNETFIAADPSTTGMYTKVYGVDMPLPNATDTALSGTDFRFKYDTNVRNNKALALHNTYVVQSLSSGAKTLYEAKDLVYYDPVTQQDAAYPSWIVQTDPAPNGTNYMRPMYYYGALTQPYEDSVPGLPWINAGMVYDYGSGVSLVAINANRSMSADAYIRDIDMQAYGAAKAGAIMDGVWSVGRAAGSVLGSLSWSDTTTYGMNGSVLRGSRSIGMLGNGYGSSFVAPNDDGEGGSYTTSSAHSMGGVNDLMRTLQGIYNAGAQYLNTQIASNRYEASYIKQLGDNRFNAYTSAYLQPPVSDYPVTINNAAYLGNVYQVSHITLSDTDLARFDRFLSMYGYAQDQALTQDMLHNRTLYNYIQARDVQCKGPNMSLSIANQISDILSRGIRLWHSLPHPAAYDLNSILPTT